MKKILSAAALAAMTAGMTLSIVVPANASPNWVPDEVVIQAVPSGQESNYARGLVHVLNAKPGDTFTIDWIAGGDCGGMSTCPYIHTPATTVQVLEYDPLFAPSGADTLDGATTYPAYSEPFIYDSHGRSKTIGNGPYDRAPGISSGPRFIAPPADGTLVWVSDETSDEAWTGDTWHRVAWGINDAWVPEDFLVQYNEAALVTEPTTEAPGEPTTEATTEPTTEAPGEPTTEVSDIVADKEMPLDIRILQAGRNHRAEVWAVFGLTTIFLAGLMTALTRRRERNADADAATSEES